MDKSRFRRVMDALAEMGADQMLITDPKSIFYLTGYDNFPHERFMGLLLKRTGENVFFLNNLFMPPEEEDTARVWYSDTDPVMDMVAEHIDHSSVLGVDKDIKARFLLPLMEKGAAAGFINSSLAVDTTRGIKDDDEKAKMRRASQINDAAMAEFRALVKEGVTEKEIEEQMLDIYLKLGAEGFSFDPIVSFGANAADPHHSPDGTVLRKGDVVLFDVGCIADGYCSDMTRTIFMGCILEEIKPVYDLVLKNQNNVLEEMRNNCSIKMITRGVEDSFKFNNYTLIHALRTWRWIRYTRNTNYK